MSYQYLCLLQHHDDLEWMLLALIIKFLLFLIMISKMILMELKTPFRVILQLGKPLLILTPDPYLRSFLSK